MKALFYTATTIFIALAGVIAYFALQSPSSIGGARIVLDIDIAGMPQVEGETRPNAPLDPYGNEKDDRPGDAAQNPAAQDNPPAQSSDSGNFQPSAGAYSDSQPVQDARGEEIPSPPPGTALAGLQQDGPLFRELAPEPPTGENPGPAQTAKVEEQPFKPAGASLEPSPPPSSPRDAARGPADVAPDIAPPTISTASATPALPAPAEIAAPVVLPPPPVPVRRPADIPGPEERVAAADGNFGGLQFATTEVATPKEARVAILLRGVGRSEQDGAQAIARLPSAVSLGFLPYALGAERLAAEAREKGHEIIVQLPLEPTDYPTTDPGPDTLLTSLPPEENAARLEAVLTRFQGHSGVTNLMGGKLLQSKASLKPMLENLKARGLVYVGESNNSSAAVRQVAREINLRYGAAQVIDAQATPEAIDRALTRLVALARQNGSAIGMGYASAVTIAQVQAWSEKLAPQGVTLVPVGALAQTPGSS